MTTTVTERLDAALARDEDFDLLDALASLEPSYNGVDFSARPEPLRTFGLLYLLYAEATNSGVWRFFAEVHESAFAPTLEACRTVGAARAVVFLETAGRLFPRGRVPDDREKRQAVVMKLEEKASDAGRRDPFSLLDEEYADAMPALALATREWVAGRRAALEAELAAVPVRVRERRRPETDEEAEARRKRSDERWVATLAQEEAERVAFRAEYTALGLLPWVDHGTDPRYQAWIDAVTRLGADEWRAIGLRAAKSPRKVQNAEHEAGFSLGKRLIHAELPEKGAMDAAHSRDLALRKPAFEVVKTLPKQEVVDGRSVGTLGAASGALVAGSVALLRHDWLMVTPEGRKAARVAYALFDGYAPTPAVPAEPRAARAKRVAK